MAILRRFANLFRRSAVDRDIDAELQAHIDLRIDVQHRLRHVAGRSPPRCAPSLRQSHHHQGARSRLRHNPQPRRPRPRHPLCLCASCAALPDSPSPRS